MGDSTELSTPGLGPGVLPVQTSIPGPGVTRQSPDDRLDNPGPRPRALPRLHWPGLAAGQGGLGVVVRGLGEADIVLFYRIW